MFSFDSLNDERPSSYTSHNFAIPSPIDVPDPKSTWEYWDNLFLQQKNANRAQKEQQPPIDVHAKYSSSDPPSKSTAREIWSSDINYKLGNFNALEKAHYEQIQKEKNALVIAATKESIRKSNLKKCKNVEQQVTPPVIIAKSKFSIYLDGFNTAYTNKYVNFVKPYECLTERSYNDKSGLGYDGTSSNLLGVFLPSSEVLLPIIECSTKADLIVKVTQLERYIKKQILHDFHPLVPFQGTKFQSYVNIKITFDRFRVLDYFSMTRPPDLD